MSGVKIAAWGFALVATLLVVLHLQIIGVISLRFSLLVATFILILIGMLLIAWGCFEEVMERSLYVREFNA